MVTHAEAHVFTSIIPRQLHQAYFYSAFRVNIHFVVVLHYAGVQSDEPAPHSVAKRTAVSCPNRLTAPVVVSDVDNPSE